MNPKGIYLLVCDECLGTGMFYNLSAEADGARVEPAVTGSAGCMQFEAVNEEKTVLHWIDDAIQAGDVYFVRADAE